MIAYLLVPNSLSSASANSNRQPLARHATIPVAAPRLQTPAEAVYAEATESTVWGKKAGADLALVRADKLTIKSDNAQKPALDHHLLEQEFGEPSALNEASPVRYSVSTPMFH